MTAHSAGKIFLFPLVPVCFAAAVYSCAVAQEDGSAPSSAETRRTEAVQLARGGKLEQAIPLMEDALRLSGHAPDFSYDYVVMLSWAGRHQDAIRNFEAIGISRTIPDYVLPEAAASYRRIGEYDTAIRQYSEYLSRHPMDRTAIYGIIYCYLDTGRTEEATDFISRMNKDHPDASLSLKSLHADVLFKKGDVPQSLKIYTEVLKSAPDDIQAHIGIIKGLISLGRGAEMARDIDKILEQEPRNYEALICKGEILEAQQQYFPAFLHYEGMLALYPQSTVVSDLKFRSLSRLGCTSLVRESIQARKEPVDPALETILSGDEAMQRIRWNEPREAAEIIARNDMETSAILKKNPDHPSLRDAILRNYFDGVESLRMQEYMTEVVRQYTMMRSIGIPVPPWTLVQTADALLYLERPEESLALYQKALRQQWDPEGSTRMAIYYTLIELGIFEEAEARLYMVDRDTPAQIIMRGVLRDNWLKEDIAVNRGWGLLYQDRLAEAQTTLLDLLSKAPANTHIRTALAQTYLWRGWPRLALEEFRISRTLDEKDAGTAIGIAYALNENDRGEEARRLSNELGARYPANKHIKRLNRYFAVEDMRLLTVNAEYVTEDPGAHGLSWSTRIDQPIKPWRSLFAEYVWQRGREDGQTNLTRRYLVGTDWRLTRDWWFTGGVSFDYDGSDTGHFETLTLTPDDYWLFSAGYDSHIIDMPLRAAASGVRAEEYSVRARYRASESLIAQILAASADFNDSNTRTTCSGTIDAALTTAAYWKTRVTLEGSAQTNSETDVNYFSPESLYTIYLVPMVEHVWFRRYERALVDRFFAGLGNQWQAHYGSRDVWYLRYELDHRMSDLWGILLGTVYAQKNFDGEDTDVWTTYLTFKRHF